MNSTKSKDKDGNEFWKNSKGQFHRENGPAIIWRWGFKEWWIDGKPYGEEYFKSEMRMRKIESLDL